MRKLVALLLGCMLLLVAGCASNQAQGQQSNYEETKKMLVDLLKSDDGKKAIQEVLTDEDLKKEIVMDHSVVKTAITEALTSKEAEDFWKEAFKDPKLTEAMAKGMQKENKQLLKDLMKDPEYQKMLMGVLKNPEMEKQVIEILKTQQMRDQISKVMVETFESPLMKGKLQDMLTKAVEEQLKAESKKAEEKTEE